MTKRIGLLTSGGDCAGLNAVIRAVTYRATEGYGWQVMGLHQGTHGLLQRPPSAETLESGRIDAGLLRLGGTILGTTNTGNPFAFPRPDGSKFDRSSEVIDGFRLLNLDALIGIGGDGSLDILRRLTQKGAIPFVGIPKTIDNDIGLTELSVGFSSAVAVATQALDQLQPTAASHSRVMVLEVMGRDAGHIALAAGVAGGADAILLPEISWQLDGLKAKIEAVKSGGRNFALVVVAEAVKTETGQVVRGSEGRYGGIGHYVGERISEATGAETRVTVLGHLQRGASPTYQDRLIASAFGVHAVDLVAAKKFDRMVAWRDRRVIDVPLAEAIAAYAAVRPDDPLLHTARGLGIYVGNS